MAGEVGSLLQSFSFTQTYSHSGLSSPGILSDLQVCQVEGMVDMALQEDLGSA